MKVRDIMSTSVVTVTENTPLSDAKKIMEAHLKEIARRRA